MHYLFVYTYKYKKHIEIFILLCPIKEINKNMINKDGQKQIPEKGPVMLLYELFNDVNIECASADGAQHSRFKMIATVNDKKFEGTGKYSILET